MRALVSFLLFFVLAQGDENSDCGWVLLHNFDTSSFAKDLQKVDMIDPLNTGGPYTIFAPDDKAFDVLSSGLTWALTSDKLMLRRVMEHHIYNGTGQEEPLWEEDLSERNAVQTIGGGLVRLSNASGEVVVGPSDCTTNIVLVDVPCAQGVIHVVDKVLCDAPFASFSKMNLANSVRALPQSLSLPATQRFSIAASLSGFLTILSETGPLTVLVPSDQAVLSAGYGNSTALIEEALRKHILEGFMTKADFQKPGSARTHSWGSTTLLWSGDGMIEGNTIDTSDVYATNGVLHTIGEVFKTPGVVKNSISSVIAQNPDYREFSQRLRSTGLARLLSGSWEPFTAMVPVNSAFWAMPSGVRGYLDNTPVLLRHVLMFHLIAGVQAPPYHFIGRSARTLLTEMDQVSWAAAGEWEARGGNTTTLLHSNTTTETVNGMIIEVVSLLRPDGVFVPTQTVAQMLAGDPELSRAADWLGKVIYKGVNLVSGTGPITVVAFTNGAYAALTQDEKDNLERTNDGNLIRKTAALHILRGYHTSDRLVAVGSLSSYDRRADGSYNQVWFRKGKDNTIECSAKDSFTVTASVITVDEVAVNGVLHIIDKVLLPPEVDAAVHSGYGWERCVVVKDGNISSATKDTTRCKYEYQCYAFHSAEQLKDSGAAKQGGANDVFFIVCCTLFGCLMFHHHHSLLPSVPYELLVFILAGVFGALASLGYPLGDFDGLADLQPTIIFYIFLPPLIFHTAFVCDTHLFKRLSREFLIVAGPGVLLTALLMAVLAKVVFSTYEWSMYTCMVYGALLAATDPVSVVTNMDGLVAAPKLTTMMVGESLFSSGISIALVELMKNSIPEGAPDGGWHILFLQLMLKVVGGPLVGLLVGNILTRTLKDVFNDAIIEITATFVATYVVFFVCEAMLQVSGTLAVMALGAYVSYKETCISPEVLGVLRTFWQTIVFVTKTLVFALTGLIVVQHAFKHVKGSDFGNVVIAYIGLNVIRAFVFALLSPVLKRFARARFSTATLVLFSWTGLRGVISLCLGMIIKGDNTIHCFDKYLGDRFLFHAVGVGMLTLCINGTLAISIVEKFGLNEVTLQAKRNMRLCFAELKTAMEEELLNLKLDFVLSDANWNRVKQITYGELEDPYNKDKEKMTLASQAELQEQARSVYYSLFDAANMQHFRDGLLLGSAQRVLHRWRSNVIDQEAASRERMRPLIGSERLQKLWTVPTWKRKLCKCRLEHLQVRRMGFGFNVLLGFIHAHDHIIANIDRLATDSVASSRIKEHCRRVRQEATTMMAEATGDHAEVSIAMRTKAAARNVLNAGRQDIIEQQKRSLIEPRDAQVLRKMVERQMKKIPRLPRSLARSGNDETLAHWVGWYRADSNCKYQLARLFRYHVFEQDSRIFKKGNEDERRGFYVVLKGLVRLHHRGSSQIYGQGYCIGLLSSLTDKPGLFTDVWAESFLHVARFPAAEVRQCARIYPTMKDEVWLQAGREAAAHCLMVHHPWLSWDRRKFERFIRGAKIAEITRAAPTSLRPGFFYVIFAGRVTPIGADQKDALHAVALIPERLTTNIILSSQSMVLEIPDPTSAQAKARRRWNKIHERIRIIRSLTWLQGWEGYKRELRKTFAGAEDPVDSMEGSFVFKEAAGMERAEERRQDPVDHRWYTLPEFLAFYNGRAEWDAAAFTAGQYEEERRCDPADGRWYTLKQFVQQYGGTLHDPPKEWEGASSRALNRAGSGSTRSNGALRHPSARANGINRAATSSTRSSGGTRRAGSTGSALRQLSSCVLPHPRVVRAAFFPNQEWFFFSLGTRARSATTGGANGGPVTRVSSPQQNGNGAGRGITLAVAPPAPRVAFNTNNVSPPRGDDP
eukprot:Hpha_TRINITY_DN19106_c0_g1::TRINITY_DN19106_c0_g1_i1::g.94822::m.94822